jgi:hypothetical protein
MAKEVTLMEVFGWGAPDAWIAVESRRPTTCFQWKWVQADYAASSQ